MSAPVDIVIIASVLALGNAYGAHRYWRKGNRFGAVVIGFNALVAVSVLVFALVWA